MVAAQNRLETTGAFTASLQLFLLLHEKTLALYSSEQTLFQVSVVVQTLLCFA